MIYLYTQWILMWLTYSLLGLLFLGIGDFIKKAMIKKGGDKEVFLFTCFVIYMILLGINYFLHGEFVIDGTLMSASLIIGFFDILTPLGLLAALKYLDTSLAFISIRITASFLVLYIGIYILGDSLSLYNILGFFLGVIAIFFLSGFRFSEKHKIHIKGVIATIMAIIGITGAHSYFKYVVNDIDIPSYMFFKFLVSFLLLILYMLARKKFLHFHLSSIKKILPYSLITCLVFLIYFLYLLPNIYILGPLSLGYKILSYSLVVPIFLSIILYGEEVTKKKGIAFLLTVLSISLFLI